MAETTDTLEQEQGAPTEKAAPITSRFLFVDVAAQRAKQLRRGALPRLERVSSAPHKLERVAMEEVRQRLVQYTVPPGFEGAAGQAE